MCWIFSCAHNHFWLHHFHRLFAQRTALSSGINIRFRAVYLGAIRSMSIPISSSFSANEEVEQVRLLTAINDDYEGVIAELKEPMEPITFVSVLRASIAHWREQGKKGVWIKVPIEYVNLVETAVKEGFWFHHAEPNYLMLVYWIPKTAHTIPSNATHRVGIGAVVMNQNNEVLVVQEKTGKFQGTGVWKFPTGVVDQGEDICMAAVREVKEETGIDAEFIEVMAFRQSHQIFFQKSDLFFVCILRPLSHDIRKQELEIEDARWMPFEEYAAQEFNQKHELLRYIIRMCSAKKDGKYYGFTPVPTMSTFSTEKNFLYLNNHSFRQE
ncbi:hypothetical protein SAY87_010566 [Trapa incisa]|uniref:Nudix hydrolase domain-containing protein n=2 Tax=Trapa TaxID=22665 RepID=A0AAN7M007_TRANT|nr:hypothetical protein SAY87_010566 [Trapa incisa]KAK4794579.1 hypothetical protein SAY86_012573 [Trapa natans]